MVELNAAQRLLAAESEWWTSLSDTMKEQYVEEHPESKYAKEWHKDAQSSKPAERAEPDAREQKSEPQKENERKKRGEDDQRRERQEQREPTPAPAPAPAPGSDSKSESESEETEHEKQEPAKPAPKPKAKSAPEKKPQKFNPKDPKYAKAMAAGGSARKRAVAEVTEGLNEDLKSLTNMAIRDMGAAVKSTVTVGKLLLGRQGEIDSKDMKNIARTLFNFCGVVALGGAFGLGGPAALLMFGALKYSSYKAAQTIDDYLSTPKYDPKAERGTPQNPDYGYWGNSGKWNELTKDEWENLSDEEIERMAVNSKIRAAKEPTEEESVEAVLKFVMDFANSGQISDQAWRKSEQDTAKRQS